MENASTTTQSKSLSERIKDAQDSDIQVEYVEEWGFEVGIQSLTARERIKLESFVLDVENKDSRYDLSFRVRLLCWSLVDPETGELIYQDEDIGVQDLFDKNSIVVERLAAIAIDKNAIGAEQIEGIEGNS